LVRSAKAELRFNASNPVVYVDHFPGEGVELEIHAIESRINIIEPRVHASFQTADPSVGAGMLHQIRQDSDQNGEGWYPNREI
jgi:hypothetical protein